ncbi:MAG: hypothetical protein E5X38_07225 [Mesorhizobium sp.]|uniref:hypothetical protein n=1 Tax=unclassified Mesorhizobium TaxID=325217 RepID=UPI000FCB5093|nr:MULTISPECIES: hypothetical protein [unclassified Mesorhizobium]RUV13560.1 hypothetical protein EOA91_25910 [Mesorhizobium sp. M1A.F.Ca.IN.022.04.1.1]RUV63516.1 hypothetical protein EOA64_08900 [Mesorhizobium sp. M1A.F.Ca.IN.022.02.1.1]RWG27390.1 MAG: hypothetical protein EOQ60_25580 [Mesorhizobium sp.]RWH26997.1 MAG: hypothetical protein EOQ75_03665 [Mesorhizobium sp.]TIM35988.1 MAG: hypothetical protein E5Y45_00300 [Mesorhizobium sp.]
MAAQHSAGNGKTSLSRRTVISGLAAGALAPAAVMAAPDHHERASQLADALARSMAAIHGGEWRACINHNTAFVLIKPV